MRIIDTHSHLYVPEFSEDIADVVERAQAAAVEKVLLPNINAESVDKMLKNTPPLKICNIVENR